MKYYFFLFCSLLPILLFSQVYPPIKPAKPLQALSLAEVNAIFKEANKQYKQQKITKFADEMCQKLNGAILISQNDIILVNQSSGYRLLTSSHSDPNNKITNTTRFELASVSKQFTATAILKLVSENKMSLNDLLTKYFPQLPYKNITIHHLLSHTSGLPEYFNFSESWFDTTKLINNMDVINILQTRKPKIMFLPGAKFKYTNTNYAILAAIVEKVSGISFEKYVAENIFKPAGMTRSCYVTEIEDRILSNYALGHFKDGKPLPIEYMDGSLGDKGLYSTTGDLFLWKKSFFKNKIIPAEYVQLATQPQNKLKSGKPEKLYGYGFRIEESPEYGKLIYHGGLWHGYHHLMLYYPAQNIYMVFLSNYYNKAHNGKSSQVLHILCGA